MSNALGNYAREQKEVRVNTPLGQRTPGRTDEIMNNTGSYVFEVADKSRLERFLILGTDGGTYYVGERKLTAANVQFLRDLIVKNEQLVRNVVLEVSTSGRASKNGPALFALALLLTEGKDKAETRAIVPLVARHSTALFEFVDYINSLGGWGQAKTKAIAAWYQEMPAGKLAYQAVKYRSRTINGQKWTHRDLFRLSHPKGVDQAVGNFILGKTTGKFSDSNVGKIEIVDAFHRMQRSSSVKSVIETLDVHKNLPWETIPTEFLKSADVWKKLFYNNQLEGQALVRNITRLARIGAFDDMVFAADYAERLTNEEMIAKTRLHPINYLNAAVVFGEGQINRREEDYWGGYSTYGRIKDWKTNGKVLDALNEGFYLAHKYVEPSGKRHLVAVDVSGSMAGSAGGKGSVDLSAAQVAGAQAMVVARTEKYSDIVGFSSGLVDLGITAKTSLAEAMSRVQKHNFGSTNPSATFDYAIRNKIAVDVFTVITDNEVNHGRKPYQSLRDYRQKMGIDAKLVVVGVTATEMSIADSNDKGMLDVVGFDANAPKLISDFAAGRI